MCQVNKYSIFFGIMFIVLCSSINDVFAAKLISANILDKDYISVHLSDGEVIHHEGTASEEIIRYTPEVDTDAATQVTNWTITSLDDSNYNGSGQNPQQCYRKKKLSGHAQLFGRFFLI